MEATLLALASVLLLGTGAEWLAWRLRLPSIGVLLLFGFAAGPATGLLDPDALFGELLVPVVSVSVAIILFEGGLSLRIADLPQVGGVVRNLLTVGAGATWVIASAAAHLLLDLDVSLAVLLGAIVVVTGPTVIGPLLRHLRPVGPVGSILHWEGIAIDPLGAMFAVLVFEGILVGTFQAATAVVVMGVVKTVLIGGILGLVAAALMVVLLERYWLPDFLHNPVALSLVVAAFTAANALQTDSGLLAATVMGIALASQRRVGVGQIVAFKENLRVLLISSLFIVLAARLRVTDLAHVWAGGLAFLAVLVVVARPVAVALSTLRSGLGWRERAFLAALAPRGIVAAAVSSVFALRLSERGYAQAELLVPLTFVVIIGTVVVYGAAALPVARWLKVAEPNPQGVLIVGSHSWAQEIGRVLQGEGYAVQLVDTNWSNVSAARLAGVPAYYGSPLSESVVDDLNLDGLGRLLALTSNDGVNSLAARRFAEIFGRAEVYQLVPKGETEARKGKMAVDIRARVLFGPHADYAYLSERFATGAVIKVVRLSEQFDYGAFQRRYGEEALPLFLITEAGALTVFAVDNAPTPGPGQTLIGLVDPVAEPQGDS